MPRNQVFVSYSHKDKRWLERLQTMLKPLVRNRTISVWDDTTIPVGGNWKEQIDSALAVAKVAVLLVTPNFLASDFIAKNELPPILNAAAKDGLVILWVYVSSCLYQVTEIKDYKAAHDISKTLDSLSAAKRNAALAAVCIKIEDMANRSTETSPEDSLKDAVPQSAPPVGQKPESPSTPEPLAIPVGISQIGQYAPYEPAENRKETTLYHLYSLALFFRRQLLDRELPKLDSALLERDDNEKQRIIGNISNDLRSLSGDAQVRGMEPRAVIESFDSPLREEVVKTFGEVWQPLHDELLTHLKVGLPASELISKTLHEMKVPNQFFLKASSEELNHMIAAEPMSR